MKQTGSIKGFEILTRLGETSFSLLHVNKMVIRYGFINESEFSLKKCRPGSAP